MRSSISLYKKASFIFALAAVLAFFPACAGTSPPAPSDTLVTGNRVGNLAPDFNLKDVDGSSLKLSSYAGRPVVVSFWSLG